MISDPNSGLVSCFSRDANKFAFQSNASPRYRLSIYPLNGPSLEGINSSQASFIDYEQLDLEDTDLTSYGWCHFVEQSINGTRRGKRKVVEDEGTTDGTKEEKRPEENFLVGAFSDGKVVVFSPDGKDIVNILKSAETVVQIDTNGQYVWALYDNNQIRAIEYGSGRVFKSFKLKDFGNGEVVRFQALDLDGETTLISLMTREAVFFREPKARSSKEVSKFEIPDAISCYFSDNGEKVAIASRDGVYLFRFSDGEQLGFWKLKPRKLRIFGDLIYVLTLDGRIMVIKEGEEEPIGSIIAEDTQILDFVERGDGILLAWLNVNEPNFSFVSSDKILEGKALIINETPKVEPLVKEEKKTVETVETVNTEPEVKPAKTKKTGKSGQNQLASDLIQALNENNVQTATSLLQSDFWDENRIYRFFATHSIGKPAYSFLAHLLINEVKRNVWSEDRLPHIWLRCLLTAGNIPARLLEDKGAKKNIKQLRVQLKSSSNSLPILLGIQGRLDMLNRQAALRKESSRVNDVEGQSGAGVGGYEATGENVIADEDGESVAFVNGESDVFAEPVEAPSA